MMCVVGLPTQVKVRRVDCGLDVTACNGTIDEVSKRGGSNGADGAGSRIILVGVWRWVFQEGTECSKVPSEDLVVTLDLADVHHVTSFIFVASGDGPVYLRWG